MIQGSSRHGNQDVDAVFLELLRERGCRLLDDFAALVDAAHEAAVESRSQFTDEGFRQLRDLLLLLELEVYSPKTMTDEALDYLGGQHYLIRCSLTGTNLSNKSVNMLQNFKYMKELHLSNSGITEEGIIILKGKMPPDCVITY